MTSSYDSSCFNVRNVAEAKAIILTPDESTTDHRWATETPYLGRLIGSHIGITAQHRVLDYGCGIGRMSKELITRYGCKMVGVDSSTSMRALAPAYVDDERFLSCPPGMLGCAPDVHYALAVWVLQHIPEVQRAIDAIHQQLRSYGRLFVLNCHDRFLPVAGGMWKDDGVDVRELLSARFNEVAYGTPDPAFTGPSTVKHAYWGVYERRN